MKIAVASERDMVEGEAKIASEQYLQGNLKSTGSICHEHQHHDECGE